jgi:hypothetical protein
MNLSILTQLLKLDFTFCILTLLPLNITLERNFFGIQYSEVSSNGCRLKSNKKSIFEKSITDPFTIMCKTKFKKIIEQSHEIVLKTPEYLHAYPMLVDWFNNYGYITKRACS